MIALPRQHPTADVNIHEHHLRPQPADASIHKQPTSAFTNETT
jgi:hypothetical protein